MNYDIVKKTVSELCMKTTGPETLDYVVGLFNRVVSEAIDLGCGKYNSVQQCRKMMPDGVDVLEQLVKPPIRPQNGTFLVPLIEITRALDEV